MYFNYLLLTTSRTLTYTRNNLSYSIISGTFFHQYKRSVKKWQYLKLQISNIHTTQKLCYPTSLTICLGSILCGYYVRKWWLRQPFMQQQMYITWFKQKKHIFYGSLAFLSFILFIYCLTCFEKDRILKKRRFILFNQDLRIKNAKILFRVIVQNKENVVPLNDPKYTIVGNAIKKLIDSNKEIFEGLDWTVTIIYRIFNMASLPNVLILPDRSIIILSDMFDLIKSNDQLIFILAHEMSHEMLLHTSETLSFGILNDIATIIFSFLIWIFYPRRIAAILCSSFYVFSSIIFAWYRRSSELEADEIGMELAAKACIDPREILVFWEIMKVFEELSKADKFEIPLFMHHPTLKKRKKRTIKLMPKILKIRKQAKCPEIPEKDPQDNLPNYIKDIEKFVFKDSRILGIQL